jgi:hypothetical protein
VTRELKPCGTSASYQRHRRRGEEPCGPCKAAIAEHSRDVRARNGIATDKRRVKVRSRALTKLAHLHPDDFHRLLLDEYAAERAKERAQ